MITTKNLVIRFEEIPREWIWSYYLDVWDLDFDGSPYTLNSIFNKEKTPSFKLFYKGDRYWFKDFSSGYGGDEMILVQKIQYFHYDKTLNYHECKMIVMGDYNNWIINNGNRCNLKISENKKERTCSVTHEIRGWNELDRRYWVGEGIPSATLTKFNVVALSQFTIKTGSDTFTIKGEYIYGFFNSINELYKIYQPKILSRKYIYVKQYLQGSDQLRASDYLIVQSGLKDIMSFDTLNLKSIDGIAPDSENVMIPDVMMKKFIKTYKQVLIMFDNDKAGHKAMKKYIDLYPDVKPLYHCIESKKDTTNIISSLGIPKSKRYFIPMIDKVISNERVIPIKQVELW